jgi:hypothetical protein
MKAREEGKMGLREKNGIKTFVISHFFLGTLDKCFSVLINISFVGAN